MNNTTATTYIKPPSTKLLLLLHADGFVELYGDQRINVITRMVPAMETRAGEIVAQEYIYNTLPIPWRRIYSADMLRATAQVRMMLPSDIVDTLTAIRVCQTVDRILHDMEAA